MPMKLVNRHTKHIISECFIDRVFIEIVCELKDLSTNKQHGKFNVLNCMEKSYKNKKALGIIDEDRGNNRPNLFKKQFVLNTQMPNINVWRHEIEHHIIIEIKPAADGFIFQEGQRLGIMKGDSLPKEYKDFCKLAKDDNIHKNLELRDLIKSIKKDCSETIIEIQKLVKEIDS